MSSSNPRGEMVIVISVVFLVFAAICVSMRVYSRLIVLKNSGWDEVAIVGSFICSIILLGFTDGEVRHGVGKRFDVVMAENSQDFTDYLKDLWWAITFYNASLTLTKASILLQYLRVFVSQGVRRTCWAALAFVAAYGIYTITSNIFACIPVSAFWSPTPDMRCISKKFSWFFNASINILSDIIIIALPIPTLNSLKLPIRQKIMLMVIFALGGFVCLVSVLRLQSLYVISNSTDPTYDNVGASIWSNIEVYMGIICASLPAVKPVLGKCFPKLLSNATRNGTINTFNTSSFKNQITSRPIRLHDVDIGGKTVTRVEADERGNPELRGSNSNGDIFITTSMRQDVERESKFESRSQLGSEKDLIIQHH